MPTFRWPDDSNRLDFELLRESPVARYFSRQVFAEHVAWLRGHGYVVHAFDCTAWSSEEDFHAEVGRNPAFLGYTGRNVTAFKDRLCQIEVPEEGGTALAFLAFDAFLTRCPAAAWAVLDVIAYWSRFFLLLGRRLLALVQTDDATVRVQPFGGRPPMWNRTETTQYARERRKPPWVGPAGMNEADVVGLRFSLLVLKTRRLEAVRDFYQALGIGFAAERHGDGPLHYAGKAGDAVLEIHPLPDNGSDADTTTRLGFSVGDLEQVLSSLRAAGATPAAEPRQTAWGVRAVARDPDGRSVELYQREGRA